MNFNNTMITDTGMVIDPDDDVEIVEHMGIFEIIYDNGVHYCHSIQEHNED